MVVTQLKNGWRAKRRIIICSAVVVLVFAVGMVVGRILIPNYLSVTYFTRIIHGDSQITDWQTVFPSRPVSNDAAHVTALPKGPVMNADAFSNLTYNKDGTPTVIGDFQQFLQANDTNSLLIIHNDHLVYENYLNGTNEATIQTSMSVAKSFLSALVGIAIEEKSIKSVDDPVVRYLPELREKISENMTIRHLLTMSGGNLYEESGGISGDDTKTYWSPDLRHITLDYFRSAREPGQQMQYNDFQPQALGMIIERATGQTLSHYMQEKLWKPAGMEQAASWSLDSQEHGFEQSAVGINATAHDFAKYGLLYLHQGVSGNQQVVPKHWVAESTHMQEKDTSYFIGWHDTNAYGYYWWGLQAKDGSYDYYARGKHGQFIYISPVNNTVIVRTGSSLGKVWDWPEVLQKIANIAHDR